MTLDRYRSLASLDAAEVRFRLTCMARQAVARARTTVATPSWDRRNISRLLSTATPAEARRALEQQRWHEAHLALAGHFATRASTFPLEAPRVPELASAIVRHFPEAPRDAARRAARIAAGEYDILGYRGVRFGAPPDWQADPVNGKRAPRVFWSAVPFLSPECGDHKVIWEINRHQHWIALGRSRILNGDVASYTTFVSQLEDWLAGNPPLMGVNWASMLELAFRTLSWLWALHLFAADARHDRPEQPVWTVDMLLALDRQLTHIEHNLSRYFSPNTHLTGEALALYVAGHALPELEASGRRVALGRDVLLREIERQVHSDGGHAELSPHYHRYTTDFYLLALLVARRAADPAAARFEEAARGMAQYLRAIADDRGMLPLIGDDDGGQTFVVSGRPPCDASPTLAAAAVALADERLAPVSNAEEVLWLCGPAAPARSRESSARRPSVALPESGYYVIRNDHGDHLVFDAGRHGFLNGGHAHADALSIVLNVRGVPLLVDPGTGVYTIDRVRRDRFRSTAMHNTLVVDERSQAEPNGPFRWRSRVDARCDVWRVGSGFVYVEGSHRAYPAVQHTRAVLAIDGFGWLIFDHLLGDRPVVAEAFWHLDPGWTVDVDSAGTAALTHSSGVRTALAATWAPLHVLPPGDPSGLTQVAPVYGRFVETHVLASRAAANLPASSATFVPAEASIARGLRIRTLPTVGVDDGWHALGVELSFEDGAATAVCGVQHQPAATGVALARRPWGTESLRTDGRAAAVVRRHGAAPIAFAVDGSVEDTPHPLAAAATQLDPITCVRN